MSTMILMPNNVLAQETTVVAIDEQNFPDEVFREYVKENFDGDEDDFLDDDEIEAAMQITTKK